MPIITGAHRGGAWLLAALLSCTLAAQTRGPLDLANAPVPAGARRIAYGADPLQFGELRVPAAKGPHPVAIVIHGGCYLAKLGAMDPRAVALDNMRPLAAALTDAGVATWNIEYRRLGDEGGGWPGTFRDVAAAADHLRTIKDAPLDLTRVIAIGHSAGGHLAFWLAARDKIPAGSDIRTANPLALSGAVNLDGPADLNATFAVQKSVCGSPVITDLLGGSPEERPERYKAASPADLLDTATPQVFFAGRMFGAQVTPYEAAIMRAGGRIQTTLLKEAGHFIFIDPLSEVWPMVLETVRRLLSMPK